MLFLYVLNYMNERGQTGFPGGGSILGILIDESQLASGDGYA